MQIGIHGTDSWSLWLLLHSLWELMIPSYLILWVTFSRILLTPLATKVLSPTLCNVPKPLPGIWLWVFVPVSAVGRSLSYDNWFRHRFYERSRILSRIISLTFMSVLFGLSRSLWTILLPVPGHLGSVGHGLPLLLWASGKTSLFLATSKSSEPS